MTEGFYIAGAFAIFSTLITLIIMRVSGIPIIHRLRLGKEAVRLDHYAIIKGQKVSLPQQRRNEWVSEIDSGVVCGICGELSGFVTSEEALKKGLRVELVCGPKIWNNDSKQKAISLMQSYPNQFKLYISNTRPTRHGMHIGNNLMIEGPHAVYKPYETAIAIRNANQVHLDSFDQEFENLSVKARLAKIEDLNSMETYN